MAVPKEFVTTTGLRRVVQEGLPLAEPTERPPLSAPPRAERLQCRCGNDHFFVSKVDFTCTVCFKSYRD